MKNKIFFNFVYLIIFLFFGVFLLKLFNSSNYITESAETICGNKTSYNITKTIENDSNYIFEPDPNFTPKQLWDIEGNTVFVNSNSECIHYVTGGWNYIPNAKEEGNSNKCLTNNYLRSKELENFRVFFIDLTFKEILQNSEFNCIGKVYKISEVDGLKVYDVFYSKELYILLTTGVFLILVVSNIKFLYSIIWLISSQLLIQLYFNLNSALNLINNVSVFSTLMIFLFLKSKYEQI